MNAEDQRVTEPELDADSETLTVVLLRECEPACHVTITNSRFVAAKHYTDPRILTFNCRLSEWEQYREHLIQNIARADELYQDWLLTQRS